MIVVNRCQILRIKCTKFDFGWKSALGPPGGAYSAPPHPLGGLLLRRERGGCEREKEWKGEGRKGEGRGVVKKG